jgi:peptidoglycan hydrolase-like protein with peptidoglycan-binding domain
MNEVSLKKLWEGISKKFNIGTYDDFKVAMSDPIRRKKFYDVVTSKKLDIGTYQEFETKIGVNTQKPPNPAPNTKATVDFPPCAIKKGKVRKTPSGADVIVYKTTVWDKPSVQLYAKTNRFLVLTDSKKGKKGNYKCTQSGKLFLELDSEKKPDPKKDEKKKQSSDLISTNLTLDDILNGKGSVKIGMKGPVVGEIQKLLIAAGYKNISKSGKVDNVFGGRTKSMVIDFQKATEGLNGDGIVGQNTLPKLKDASTKKSEYNGMGDDSPEFLQAQLDAQKSQLPVNHGIRKVSDDGDTFVWDGYNQVWLSDADYLNLYNTDGSKKLQENIIKNIVIKNLHSLL